jgi:uncharacterized protein (DUF4415 family)
MSSVPRIVRINIDPNTPPELGLDDLARFDAIKDEDIDYSDIPDMGDADWSKAMNRDQFMAFLNSPKSSVTIRLDADVIEWFKANSSKNGKPGRGYQTAMNAVLKAYVKAQKG